MNSANLYGKLYSGRESTFAVAFCANRHGVGRELGGHRFHGADETERNERASRWLTSMFGVHVNSQSVEWRQD